ncbi:MAG: type IV secretion system protein [Pseudomonadota bacterium]|nr:type IV secretion system protein [Pseudomonadota bacterium]MDE3037173.1 type IV secretion system protein [Pseudomonadota bacterium]
MKHGRILMIFLVMLACLGLPPEAHAQLTLATCAPGHQPWEYTAIVVDCVKTAITGATVTMLQGLSDYMVGTVAAMIALAIAIFGMRIVSGEQQLLPKAAGFMLRLGIVLTFSYNLGGLSGEMFGIEDQLTTLVSGGYSPWVQIDTFLGQLLGFGQGLALYQGMIGLVTAALFTSVPGIMLFSAGVMGIIKLLLCIFDIVYTYLSALTIMAFMLLISPLVVPLALFQQAERYVKKWLDILIMSILMPMLLFAFLFMFLSIFSLLVGNLYDTVGGNDFQAFWRLNKQAFSWLVPTDPNKDRADQATAGLNGPVQEVPAVPGNITPQLTRAFDLGSMFTLPGVDFGPDTIGTMQQLAFGFVTMAIFAAIMQTMIHSIPQVASSIAGVLTQVPMQFTTSPKERLREGLENMKFGGMAAGGAFIGSGTVAALTRSKKAKPVARQIGGVLGGFAGPLLGKLL